MSRWYRAYEGTVSDPKLHEAAVMAKVSRSVVIAVWHSVLENCAVECSGKFETTALRIALILNEKEDKVIRVLDSIQAIGLINDGVVTKWDERQFQSDTSTERVQRHRAKKKEQL